VGVSVPVSITPATASFSSVSVEGFTTISIASTGPAFFSHLRKVPPSPAKYYNIATTATYTGPVHVCINYVQGDVLGNESKLLLYYYDTSITPNSWRAITTSVDANSNVICGDAGHVGTFLIAEPGSPTGIDETALPKVFRLYPNFPNPFRAGTMINYDLPEPGLVSLEVYDLQGRRVNTLVAEDKAAGRYSVPWTGQNESGQMVAPGIYFYRLQTPKHTATQKLLKVS
jgi:hypothetical protein